MSDKKLFDTGWLAIKETPNGFFYSERKGKDSIALFLIREKKENIYFRLHGPIPFEVLMRYQPMPIYGEFTEYGKTLYPCPITGSVEDGKSLEECAINEAMEEAGYDINGRIQELGKYAVGTQTNEVVHMFYADVTGLKPKKIKGDGTYFESISENKWESLDFLNSCLYGACQIGYFKLMGGLE